MLACGASLASCPSQHRSAAAAAVATEDGDGSTAVAPLHFLLPNVSDPAAHVSRHFDVYKVRSAPLFCLSRLHPPYVGSTCTNCTVIARLFAGRP